MVPNDDLEACSAGLQEALHCLQLLSHILRSDTTWSARPLMAIILVMQWSSVDKDHVQESRRKAHPPRPLLTVPARISGGDGGTFCCHAAASKLPTGRIDTLHKSAILASIGIVMVSQDSVPGHLQPLCRVHICEAFAKQRVIQAPQPMLIKIVAGCDDERWMVAVCQHPHPLTHIPLVLIVFSPPITHHKKGQVWMLLHGTMLEWAGQGLVFRTLDALDATFHGMRCNSHRRQCTEQSAHHTHHHPASSCPQVCCVVLLVGQQCLLLMTLCTTRA
mmetsp:Transcript_21593/g.59876  ORF Transcript_21593/g.59876 Transcript_21593/m.59876 type:complete len:276 (+) Transcript_21593:1188-2015(+)